MTRRWPTLVLLLSAVSWGVHSQVPAAPTSSAVVPDGRPSLQVPRVSRAPRLADFITATPREAEARIDDFRQREPGDGVPVTQPTSAFLSYDSQNLYVAFVCKDARDAIRGRMSKREDIQSDDQVAVYLDTFHDRRHAYLFAVNPLGVQSDALVTEGQDDDYDFDTVWRSEGRLTEDGYVVLLSIPFKSLRFPRARMQDWGIALGRVIFRNDERSFWPYISKRYQGFAQQMANLEGIEAVSPGRNIQLIPYSTFTAARQLDETVPAIDSTTQGRAGIDGKVVLRDALTLDFTANPDFSQVESDNPQVTVNKRFEVLFPEKRPFFLENSSFFQTPVNLFFSRRIVDPGMGVRLTGKVGPWAIGVLGADDRNAQLVAPDSGAEPTDELYSLRTASIGVLRVEREFGEQSSIGMFVSDRNAGGTWNRVYSLDSRLKLSKNWVFTSQFIYSETRRRGRGRFSGPAAQASLAYLRRHLEYVSEFQDRSPNFRSDLGYIPRVDIREFDQNITYLWRPKSGPLISFGPTLAAAGNWNRAGRVQEWFGNGEFEFDFRGATQIKISRFRSYELYQNRGFQKNGAELSFSTDRSKWFGIFGSVNWGTGVNYDPAPEVVPFLGRSLGGSFGFTFRPTPQLSIAETYLYDSLRARASVSMPGAPSVYNNHLGRSKVNYQFTKALSLRAIIDYNAVLPNPALIDLVRTKAITGDVLITWLLQPGTALYVGYNSQYQNLALDPGVPPVLRWTGAPTIPGGRQFFIKLSYLFRP